MNSGDRRPLNTERSQENWIFKNTQKIGVYTAVAFGISLFFILLALINAFLLFLSDKNQPLAPAFLSGMFVFAVFGIMAGLYLLNSPVRIVIGRDGLTIEGLIRRKFIPWNQIAQLDVKKEEGFPQNWLSLGGKEKMPTEKLILLDENEKKIGEIYGKFEQFGLLIQTIRDYSTHVRGISTFHADKHQARQARSQKRNRVLMLTLGMIFILIGIGLGTNSLLGQRNRRLLQNEGVNIDAKIVKHYIYNVTPRLEYSFVASDGQTYTKNVMVQRKYWDTLSEEGTVPVRYLPSSPSHSRLVSGQDDSMELSFPLDFGLSVLAFLMGLFFAVLYFLKIADIKTVDGKLRIIRLGQQEISPAAAALLDEEPEIEFEEPYSAPPPAVPPPSPYTEIPFAVVADTYERPRLPGGLKAIGILNIVFGSLGALWNGGRILLAILLLHQPILTSEPVELTSSEALWVFISHSLHVFLSLLLVISGIGILMFRNWGRITAIIAAGGKLILGIVEIVHACLQHVEITDPEQKFIFTMTRLFYIILIVLTLIYPAIVFFLLNRRSTRELFLESKEETQNDFFTTKT